MFIKRIWWLLLIAALLPLPSFAQVTATITDAGGQAWNNGTWTITLIPPPGGAITTPQKFTGTLSASAALSQALTVNAQINPSGTLWNFNVCPQATAPCYSTNINITSANQNVTSLIVPPAITINMGNPPPNVTAYADAEIVGAVVGQSYFNLTTISTRVCIASPCTGSNWGGGGGTGVFGTGAVVGPIINATVPSTRCPGCTAKGTATCWSAINQLNNTTGGPCVPIGISTTGASNVVTWASGTPGLASMVGQKAWMFSGNSAGGGSVCIANGTTVTAFTATTITVSGTTPPACSANAVLVIGPDDTAALQAAFTAASGELYIPCGNYMVTSRPFYSAGGVKIAPLYLHGGGYTCTEIWFSHDFPFNSDGLGELMDGGPTVFNRADITFDGLLSAPNLAGTVLIRCSAVCTDTNVQVKNWFPTNNSNQCWGGASDNYVMIHPLVANCSASCPMSIQTLKTDILFPDIGSSGQYSFCTTEQATRVIGGTIGGGTIATIHISGSQSSEIVFEGTSIRSGVQEYVLLDGTNSTAKFTNVTFGPYAGQVDDTNATTFKIGSASSSIWSCNSRLYSTGTGFIVNFTAAGKFYDSCHNELTQNVGGGLVTGAGTIFNYPSEPSFAGRCLLTSQAGPLACGFSANGKVAVPVTTTSYTINTSAPVAGSTIIITPTTDNSGIPGAPTCGAEVFGDGTLSATSAGTSFTFTMASAAVIKCYIWSIR
jgi:hypothetical protein